MKIIRGGFNRGGFILNSCDIMELMVELMVLNSRMCTWSHVHMHGSTCAGAAAPKAPQQIKESRRSAPSALRRDGDFFGFWPLNFWYFGLDSVRFGSNITLLYFCFTSRIIYYLTIFTAHQWIKKLRIKKLSPWTRTPK